MWIVLLALRNPYSVAVFALVLIIMGGLSVFTMIVDVFPVIDIPVVSVIWSYPGLPAEEMERRVVIINERAFSTTVQGVASIESQSIPGIGNIRVHFQPGTDIGSAVAQIVAVCQTILRIMPPGMTPPSVLPFNAGNVPVAQLTLFSNNMSEQSLFDYALNFIRVRLFVIPGLATPAPYGGSNRQINIDVNPTLSAAKGISPQDIANVLQSSNLILPAGTARIGLFEYNVLTNSSPLKIQEFNQFPIKVVNERPVKLGEVATVSDSHAIQTNIVRINEKRAIYLNIIKKADASTLKVVNSVKTLIPSIEKAAPSGMNLRIDFDQSVFVRAAVNSILQEGFLAAFLVSLMVLIFLGSWRSVVIVCTSIPLSILASIIGLKLTGNSLNIMTLGGLALSIGMLVDDATVEIENINRNRPLSHNITSAILHGASQIALPAIVTTLAICIVFFPIALLTGPAKFLFVPLSEAVVFSMFASYILSRTLVPVLAQALLRNTPVEPIPFGVVPYFRRGGLSYVKKSSESIKGNVIKSDKNSLSYWGEKFNEKREKFLKLTQNSFALVLTELLKRPRTTLIIAVCFLAISFFLPIFVVGTDFFPTTDVGMMKMHFRAPPGTRLEETEKLIAKLERSLYEIIPSQELETINAMIGVPTSYNLAFIPTDNAASMDAEILVALKGNHRPSAYYRNLIRQKFTEIFPGSVIYFQPADIVSQVLNFGLTAPIDVQIQSRNSDLAYEYAKRLRDKIRLVPGTADVVIKQILDYPSFRLNVDRERAAQLGLIQKDIASSLLVSLSSSSLIAPSYFLNPENGVNYPVVVQVPIPEVASISELYRVPITSGANNSILQDSKNLFAAIYPHAPTQTVGNLVTLDPTVTLNQVNHVNVQRILDVTSSVEGRDLGSVARDIQKIISSFGELPKELEISLKGQNEIMEQSFKKLGLGMVLAAALVYLLMVSLFQSWLDPLVIVTSIPASLAGILWSLALTGTTINVESLMGSVMAIGIAVSNSNLLVNFANDFRVEKKCSAFEAALEAGKVRLRPILMTAFAMILGMIPTAFGLSEAGSQNSPLGRAVIGGLVFSTFATLFVVPVVYSLLRVKVPHKYEILELFKKEWMLFEDEMKAINNEFGKK